MQTMFALKTQDGEYVSTTGYGTMVYLTSCEEDALVWLDHDKARNGRTIIRERDAGMRQLDLCIVPVKR